MNYEEAYTLKKDTFRSSDGKHNTAFYVFTPKVPVRGIIQISHGMCEYVMRYADFAGFMCSHGFAVCGNDHLGHGQTAADDDDLGFTVEGGGVTHILNDLNTMNKKARELFPGVPLVLLGHSMGSFIARLYLTLYPATVNAAIISGTAGPEKPVGLAKLLVKFNMFLFGRHHRSKMLTDMAFASYSKKYPKGSPDLYWISRDEEIRRAYAADKYCMFVFTSQAYYDLFDILHRVSSRSWAGKIRRDMPVLIISGDMDPVGNYGKGVKIVYNRLVRAGVSDVTLKLYPDAHHEVLNEINRGEVYDDVLCWVEKKISGGIEWKE